MGIRRMALAAVLVVGCVTPAEAMVVIRRPAPYRAARRVVVLRPMRMAAPVVIAGRPHGAVDLDVSPRETLVWVDGKLAGTCGDFDGVPSKLYLLPGIHTLKLKTPNGEEHLEKMRIVAGQELNLSLAQE